LRDHLAILADGTVVPCCLDADGLLALGNILHSSLAEILAGPRARQISEGFDQQHMVEPLCRRCSATGCVSPQPPKSGDPRGSLG
jgi:radical SAM protein with 4Fe4S-binding SPASM domain